MKIHKAILIKSADKYMVRVWDSPEPIQSSDTIRKWNDSYKEYEVHPDYVDRFETYLYSEYLLPDLIKGEDLDPDLIHFEELIDAEKEIKEGVFWNPITYAILNDKPVECDHYFQMSNSFDLLPCEFCGKIKDKPVHYQLVLASNEAKQILTLKDNIFTFKGKEFTIEQFTELLNKIEL